MNMLNVGRRTAIERIAFLLLHLFMRAEQVRLTKGNTLALPLTQQHMADTLGMSLVHLNKTLKRVVGTKTVRWKPKSLEILDREALARIVPEQCPRQGKARTDVKDINRFLGQETPLVSDVGQTFLWSQTGLLGCAYRGRRVSHPESVNDGSLPFCLHVTKRAHPRVHGRPAGARSIVAPTRRLVLRTKEAARAAIHAMRIFHRVPLRSNIKPRRTKAKTFDELSASMN